MNRESILFHLKEGLEELQRTIQVLEETDTPSPVKLELGMGHLYHHLNTAWNGRNQSDDQFNNPSDEDFNGFRQFPRESEFHYLAPFDTSQHEEVLNERLRQIESGEAKFYTLDELKRNLKR